MILPIVLTLLGQSGYAGSPLEAVNAALEVADVQPSDVVLDIGCGDGRVCVLAAKRFGCRAVGIELDGNLARLSRATAHRNGVLGRVSIMHGDALAADLSAATVVYVYHQAEFLDLLRPQLESLKPGTRVVFLDHLPRWVRLDPARTLQTDQHTHQIYLWTVGAACGVEDSPLVAAGRIYPGVQCLDGLRDPLLVELAQDCAELLARRGETAYWRDGHPGWDDGNPYRNSRYRRIGRELGMTGVEVSAMSWPDTSTIPNPDIMRQIYYDWKRVPGHWAVVSTPHARFGDGMAKSANNVWYGVIITAD